MVVFLFNSVIYVSLLLCLCIRILCLCIFIVIYVLYSFSLCCFVYCSCVNVYLQLPPGLNPTAVRIYQYIIIQGDQKVFVHLMITVQKSGAHRLFLSPCIIHLQFNTA